MPSLFTLLKIFGLKSQFYWTYELDFKLGHALFGPFFELYIFILTDFNM
jgi:hypothetical protein